MNKYPAAILVIILIGQQMIDGHSNTEARHKKPLEHQLEFDLKTLMKKGQPLDRAIEADRKILEILSRTTA
jgi:hypothetical protein